MLQRIYPNLPSVDFKKKGYTNDIAALLKYKDGIKLICADGYKRCCYPILVGLMVDYEEQGLITGIKANMQCSICHIPPKRRELVTRLWKSWSYQST